MSRDHIAWAANKDMRLQKALEGIEDRQYGAAQIVPHVVLR